MSRPQNEGLAPVAAGCEPDTEVHRIPEIPLPSEPGKADGLPYAATPAERRHAALALLARRLFDRRHGSRP